MNQSGIQKNSLDFIKKSFHDYYKSTDIELPKRFTRREFAFLFFGRKGMIRHLSFSKSSQLKTFLSENIPVHAYYSSAYYQTPNAPTMQEKNWMGAELIFDLDSDHLPRTKQLSYEEQLKLVKVEFLKLVFDFLLDDFGFDEQNIDLYFSGGRGYHCHVDAKAVLHLDGNERREIVDYITGRDIIDSILLREHVTSTLTVGSRRLPISKTLTMPKPTEPGWRGRISRGIIDIVDEIMKGENPVEKLTEYGVKQKDAERLLDDLSEERVKRIREGNLDQSRMIRKFFLNSALRKMAVSMRAGETDEPVTCDVKRLIRLPFSLHGKTGFQVKKIKIDELKDFNPLTDAVILPADPVKVIVHHPLKIRMKGETFSLDLGYSDLPTYAAVFCIARKCADIL
jgi:DNA primase small subunit